MPFALLVLYQILIYLAVGTFRLHPDTPSLSFSRGVAYTIIGICAAITATSAFLEKKTRQPLLTALLVAILAANPASWLMRIYGVPWIDFWIIGSATYCITPLILCVFFSMTRSERPSFAFAIAMAAGWAALIAVFLPLGPAGFALPPTKSLAILEPVNTVLALLTAAFLFAMIRRAPARPAPLPRKIRPPSLTPPVRQAMTLRLAGATAVFYLVNGFLSAAALTPAVKAGANPYILVLIVIFLPLAGYLLERQPRFWFRWLTAGCGLAIMFAPCLDLLDNIPAMLTAVMAVTTVAQFVFFLSSTMAFAYLATPGKWWYLLVCIPSISRLFSIIGTEGPPDILAENPGIRVTLALAGCMAFYHLNRSARLIFESAHAVPSEPAPAQAEPAAPPIDIEEFFSAHGLTSREREVAEQVMRGLSSQEIARVLAISEHTVNSHAKNLLRKLNLPNRKALVAKRAINN